MKLNELTEKLIILGGNASPDTEITGIAYNSRSVKEGYIFVAIRGLQSDGHRFIPAAVKAGAAVIVCESAPEEEIPYLLVENSRLALSLLSAAFFGYPAKEMKLFRNILTDIWLLL